VGEKKEKNKGDQTLKELQKGNRRVNLLNKNRVKMSKTHWGLANGYKKTIRTVRW